MNTDSEEQDKICRDDGNKDFDQIKSDVPSGDQRSPEFYALVEHCKHFNEPISLEKLTEILGITIKYDDNTKVVTFLSMLLTYTEEDQISVGLLAESSTGKSYIPMELVKLYFPEEDVVCLGYASPTAFFHEVDPKLSYWVPDPSDDRDIEEEKKRKIHHINLERKILVFMDQPHDQLLQRLRSLLSHDRKQIEYKITDKRQSGQLVTKTTIIDGFATVIFCSAAYSKMEDQEKTRLLLLSPEVTSEKIWASVDYRIERKGNAEAHKQFLNDHPDIALLATRVLSIKRAKISHIIIKDELKNMISTHFKEKREKHTSPRYMRDVDRLIGLINAWALFNFNQRKRDGNNLIATEEDVQMGFKLYETIGEANEYGLSPEVYDIFKKLELSMLEAPAQKITRTEFQEWYRRTFWRSIGRERATQALKSLDGCGLISEEKEGTKYVYTLIKTTSEDPIVSPEVVLSSGTLMKEKVAPGPATQLKYLSKDIEDNFIAAHCKKWHSGACTFPGDPNCVVPTNPCAKTCKDYEEKLRE
jgi:hypothetical protein